MTTLLVESEGLNRAEVLVEGRSYRHLFKARRLAVGDRVRIADGKGMARWAEVVRIERSSALLQVGGPAPANELAFKLEIFVAAPRPQRASWLVEKCTEIGVRCIRFISCERSVRVVGPEALKRLQRVAVAALEQAHGSRLPELTSDHSWEDLPALCDGIDAWWYLHPSAERLSLDLETAGRIAAVIGPEGGWTVEEVADLEGMGGRPMGLGERTLRVETAAVVVAGLISASA